jgi:hypothetical protein
MPIQNRGREDADVRTERALAALVVLMCLIWPNATPTVVITMQIPTSQAPTQSMQSLGDLRVKLFWLGRHQGGT